VTFGLTFEKFLGYLVTQQGIEANRPDIRHPGREVSDCVKEVQMLNGHLTTLNRFRSTYKCKLFFQAIENGVNFCWNKDCEAAFQGLKKYISSLLSKPVTADTLFLYLAISESAVSEALIWEGGVQKPVYYVNKSLLDAETRYQRMEMMVLALFVISRKLSITYGLSELSC